jgi:ApaG protein
MTAMTALCDIQIDVVTRYLADQSVPAENRFVFAYTITITNHRNEAVRLLSRHWRITDANNHVQEVRGEGVVGEQPLIGSGESYRYSSGSMLATPVGTMEGSYQMVTTSGESFDAPIRAFSLARPGVLH